MAFVRTSIFDFSLPNAAYVRATVSFFVPDSSGNPTTTFVTLYADITGSGTLPNPQVLDSAGKFRQPVYVEQPVVASVVTGAATTVSGVIRPSLSDADVLQSIQSAGESRVMAADARRSARKAADSAASLSQGQFILAAQVFTR